MTNLEDENGELDVMLHDAGTRWRTRQVFDDVGVPTELFRSRAGSRSPVALLRGAFELVTIAAVVIAVVVLGPLAPRPGAAGGETSTATASTPVDPSVMPEPSSPLGLGYAELDAARQEALEAVNADPANFGGAYLDKDGVLVIQYVGTNAGRPSVEEKLKPGVPVRWERVDRNQTDLLRIAQEVKGRGLNGVFLIAIDTIRNRVTVSVGPSGSLAQVEEVLSGEYGAGVAVVFSSDIMVIQPGLPSTAP